MIQEQYVGFETAKLLKEKGFDEQVNSFYSENGLEGYMIGIEKTSNSKLETCYYARPTQSLAMRWLREVHNIHIVMCPVSHYHDVAFQVRIVQIKDKEWVPAEDKQIRKVSYEEACEAAIKHCLENLI